MTVCMNEDINSIITQIKSETDIFNKAKLIDHLIHKRGYRLKDIAEKLKMKPAYVCHILRLNKIPDIIIDGYYSQLVSSSHLYVISRLKTNDQMLAVYEKALQKNLTVVQIEEMVREILYGIVTEGKHLKKDEKNNFINNIQKLKQDLRVKIIQTRIKGRLEIEIKGSLENTSQALRRLMEILSQGIDKEINI